jgi:hypothetical protein
MMAKIEKHRFATSKGRGTVAADTAAAAGTAVGVAAILLAIYVLFPKKGAPSGG